MLWHSTFGAHTVASHWQTRSPSVAVLGSSGSAINNKLSSGDNRLHAANTVDEQQHNLGPKGKAALPISTALASRTISLFVFFVPRHVTQRLLSVDCTRWASVNRAFSIGVCTAVWRESRNFNFSSREAYGHLPPSTSSRANNNAPAAIQDGGPPPRKLRQICIDGLAKVLFRSGFGPNHVIILINDESIESSDSEPPSPHAGVKYDRRNDWMVVAPPLRAVDSQPDEVPENETTISQQPHSQAHQRAATADPYQTIYLEESDIGVAQQQHAQPQWDQQQQNQQEVSASSVRTLWHPTARNPRFRGWRKRVRSTRRQPWRT